jgi:hypothetical protein
VPEHPLHRLYVCARPDGQACSRVPEFVRRQPVQPDRGSGGVKPAMPEDRVA